ncbi:hypothetical protein [Cuneatibacter caecimuris]|uniref:Uncharacterized protein n=1 Tax=Cuneatibacter caecimuris TaxID=1796618 RepID=A0A4Q7P0F5_9FIRM|nr:hypothetical protein [Cuneatibacter caecimuris]RZS92748.1 hypothetical protein EV209_2817 [Cuneatibacter caecimuris]
MNPKIKRILAWAGILLLLAMYAITLVFSLIQSDFAHDMLRASMTMTFIVPIFLYAMMLIYKVLKRRDDGGASDDK